MVERGHDDFIFVWVMKQGFRFVLLHAAVRFSIY